jgi:hypothetical protein
MDLDKTENLFMICCGLYFGRKLSKDKTTPVTGESETNEETNK